MIYTFITDSEKIQYFEEIRDCQYWQPLSLISDETLQYINSAKNPAVRLERFAAYSMLFFAAEKFFGVRIKKISRGERGKPYLSESEVRETDALSQKEARGSHEGFKKIFFSISHSEGVCVVTVSDEGEVGVDVETLPSEVQMSRIEKRFFSDLNFENIFQNADASVSAADISSRHRIFLAEQSGAAFDFSPLNYELQEASADGGMQFLKKWTAVEALLKYRATGFSDLSSVERIGREAELFNCTFKAKSKLFYITVSKEKSREM